MRLWCERGGSGRNLGNALQLDCASQITRLGAIMAAETNTSNDGTEMDESGKSRIHITLGYLEIEFEGTESYLEKHLPNLIELLVSVAPVDFEDEDEDVDDEEELLEPSTDSSKKKIDLSTSTIANRLDAKSARDLVVAACAHLHLVKGREKYERKNILAEMKTATSYFKKNYTNNLTMTLKRIVKAGDLNEVGENTYALEAKKVKELEATLNAS